MTTPTGDEHDTDGEFVDPIADDRGKQGTNYPHGVGDHPDGDAWEDDLK